MRPESIWGAGPPREAAAEAGTRSSAGARGREREFREKKAEEGRHFDVEGREEGRFASSPDR